MTNFESSWAGMTQRGKFKDRWCILLLFLHVTRNQEKGMDLHATSTFLLKRQNLYVNWKEDSGLGYIY